MLERDGYPAGVPCWIDTGRIDPQAAARFYGDLFGWEFQNRMPAARTGPVLVAQLQGRDVAAIGSQTDPASAAVWNTYIWVESADEAAARAQDAGGTVVDAPFDVGEAGRMAGARRPAGRRVLRLAGAATPGSPAGERARDLELERPQHPGRGGLASVLRRGVRLGGRHGRPRRDVRHDVAPARLRRRARAERPRRAPPPRGGWRAAGFTDAIGWMMLMASDQFPDDVAPHWHVTFAVDDTTRSPRGPRSWRRGRGVPSMPDPRAWRYSGTRRAQRSP